MLDLLGDSDFIPCLHSVGAPLAPGQKDVAWPCNAEHKYIVHFPEDYSIVSLWLAATAATRYLGKKSFSLRIASMLGHEQGWLAEHMLIMGVESPARRKDLRCGGLPVGLRQNEFLDAGAADGFRRLESHYHRGRHRVDQT